MAITFKKIASVTVGSGGAADITFSSIPGTYTDLVLFLSLRDDKSGAGTWTGVKIQFNGNSSNYYTRELYGDGSSIGTSSTSSSSYIGGWQNSLANTANSFGSGSVYIPNYTDSKNKSLSTDSASETNAAGALISLVAGLWADTSAITNIAITCNSGGNWVQHSTATLYGIKKS